MARLAGLRRRRKWIHIANPGLNAPPVRNSAGGTSARLVQVFQVQEPMLREALAPQGAVEGLAQGVVHRLARRAKLDRDVLPVRSVIRHPRRESIRSLLIRLRGPPRAVRVNCHAAASSRIRHAKWRAWH